MDNVLIIEGDEIQTSSEQGFLRNDRILIKNGKIVEFCRTVKRPVGVEVIHGARAT
jgi:hypothetical protein